MLRNAIILGILLFGTLSLAAQSKEEQLNKAVYNRIEYFFNTQQADSIYQLADENFKKQISQSQLSNIIQQLYALGKINNAEVVRYEKDIAGYRIDFNTERILLVLGVDSDGYFHTLAFQQYTEPVKDKKEPVISQVEKVSTLDFAIDSIAKIHVQKSQAQSLAIAVIHDNKISKYFYGETAQGNQTLPNENTIYEIGSITKTFTATLLADLVERNIIALEDSITKFLPDSIAQNPALQKITFKTLANHTSGLPRLPENLTDSPKYNSLDPYAHYGRKELFAYLKNFNPEREPETEYEYSNLGYGLLGELIAIVSKKSYAQCVKDVITMPLHMSSTSDKVDPSNPQVAKVYQGNKEVSIWNFDALAGAGALKSTTDDMLRYGITQLAMPQTELQRAMATTKLFTYFIPPNTDIGLAWHMNIIEDITCYWHNGGTGGSSSFLGIIPDKKSVVVVLSNSNLNVDETAQAIIKKLINTN